MARAASSLLLALGFMLLPLNPAAGQVLCRSEADDVAALRMFDRAVNAYVEMHRRLEPPLAPWRISSDPEAIAAAADTLARSIRAERRDAAQGDIFGPEVADFFRVRLRAAGAAGEPAAAGAAGEPRAARRDLEGEETLCRPLPVVNSRLAWAASAPIGEALARALPALPMELEYRLTGNALVLVDVRAGLLVDLLEV